GAQVKGDGKIGRERAYRARYIHIVKEWLPAMGKQASEEGAPPSPLPERPGESHQQHCIHLYIVPREDIAQYAARFRDSQVGLDISGRVNDVGTLRIIPGEGRYPLPDFRQPVGEFPRGCGRLRVLVQAFGPLLERGWLGWE